MKYRCYGMFATDAPLIIRWIGCTTEPIRVRATLWEYGAKKQQAWIKEVQARGAHVEIRELSTHSDPKEADQAEAKWKEFWSKQGDLLNGAPCIKTVTRDLEVEASIRRSYYLLLEKHGQEVADRLRSSWKRTEGYELPLEADSAGTKVA